jgi:hypothetical protein
MNVAHYQTSFLLFRGRHIKLDILRNMCDDNKSASLMLSIFAELQQALTRPTALAEQPLRSSTSTRVTSNAPAIFINHSININYSRSQTQPQDSYKHWPGPDPWDKHLLQPCTRLQLSLQHSHLWDASVPLIEGSHPFPPLTP